MRLSQSVQCDIGQCDTQGTKRDQKPKMGIPSVLGKAVQKATQRSMSVSPPPWSSGAKMKNIEILRFHLQLQ